MFETVVLALDGSYSSDKADLIVTGTRGPSAVVGMLLGSVPQRLLHLAHCPLPVVPLPV